MSTQQADSNPTYPVEFAIILNVWSNETLTKWLVDKGAPESVLTLFDSHAELSDLAARLQCGEELSEASLTLYEECVMDSLNAIAELGGTFGSDNSSSPDSTSLSRKESL